MILKNSYKHDWGWWIQKSITQVIYFIDSSWNVLSAVFVNQGEWMVVTLKWDFVDQGAINFLMAGRTLDWISNEVNHIRSVHVGMLSVAHLHNDGWLTITYANEQFEDRLNVLQV